MPYKNRTEEFTAFIDSQRSRNLYANATETRSSTQTDPRAPLLVEKKTEAPKSEFASSAREISLMLEHTGEKLEQMRTLAMKKTLFDDRPQEIGALEQSIKKDITGLNTSIKALQDSRRTRRHPQQDEEHCQAVIGTLQSSLARTGQTFAEILETRTDSLRAQKERRDMFSASYPTQYTAVTRFVPPPELDENELPLSIDMQMTQQEMEMINRQSGYLDQRNAAVESIERTIAELAQIFQQLGSLVSQQREQVMRIDENTVDIESNVTLARHELLKYWHSLSSNRALMVKVFGLLVFFFFIFMLIF